MSVFWRVRLFILAVVVVVLACFGVYWGVLHAIHGNAAAPFKPHMAAYLAPAKENVEAPGGRRSLRQRLP